jgi:hypothetical protein
MFLIKFLDTSDNKVLCGLWLFSLFYLVQTTISCASGKSCRGSHAVALAVGAISTLLISGSVFLKCFYSYRPRVVDLIMAIFLLLLWTAGLGVGTFYGPYGIVIGANANGYLSAWTAFFLSGYYVFFFCSAHQQITAHKNRIINTTGLLLISTLFYLISSAIVCKRELCTSYVGYAIVVGAVGLIFAMLLFISRLLVKGLSKKIEVCLVGFLFLWITSGTVVGTFASPFNLLGNGYLTAWVSFFGTLALLLEVVGRKSEQPAGNYHPNTFAAPI